MSALHHSNPAGIAPPAGQYSHAVLVPAGREMLFISGQIGNRSDGSMASGFGAQIGQAFDNLDAVLGAHAMSTDNLVKLNYYLAPGCDVSEFRRVRTDRLPDPPPASTTVVTELMDGDWLFEIEAVAA
ncbi:RidA family protein [Parasphingopyxis algicola]|uniref:RidA family protein n=1 Tax=Parasphingopyxis algicola TaxID=2026624 RepID=UPI0015A00457|nr:RidA family protein [Parasphingopyxis algicola]QLC23930.1 RidA family protein [Parasphingopyxis algicola]